MDPNQQQPGGQPQYNSAGYQTNPAEQPGQPNFGQMPDNMPTPKKFGTPIILITVIVAVIFLGVGLGIGIAVSSKKPATKAVDTTQNDQNQGPLPANQVGITQTSNSISQDISANNEDKDLPATMLDDKTLDL